MTRKFSSSEKTNKTRKWSSSFYYLLELGDGLWSSQDSLGSVSCHLGGLAVSSSAKQLVELCDEQLVGSGQVVPEDEDHEHDGHQLFRTGGAKYHLTAMRSARSLLLRVPWM